MSRNHESTNLLPELLSVKEDLVPEGKLAHANTSPFSTKSKHGLIIVNCDTCRVMKVLF
jgi:hypothetical protein